MPMRCYDLRVDLYCMANLLDDEHFVILGCMFARNFGCTVMLCVLTLDIVGRSRALMPFWLGTVATGLLKGGWFGAMPSSTVITSGA